MLRSLKVQGNSLRIQHKPLINGNVRTCKHLIRNKEKFHDIGNSVMTDSEIITGYNNKKGWYDNAMTPAEDSQLPW